MKANTIKNLKFRKNYYKFELLKKVDNFLLRQFLNSPSINEKKRFLYLAVKLLDIKKSYSISKSQIKTKCALTGRNKSINKTYSLSRISLRNLMSYGAVPGYKKAVW